MPGRVVISQICFAVKNIMDKSGKILRDRRLIGFYSTVYLLKKLRPFRPAVFAISYPKCGRTWLRMILTKYFSDLAGLDEVDFYILEKLDRDRTMAFEHDRGTWVPFPFKVSQLKLNKKKYAGKRVIFLARDPRDILVSSWYHLTYRESIYTGSLSDFMRDELLGIRKIVAYMNLWLDNQHAFKAFHLVRYEDLKERTEDTMVGVLNFLGEAQIDTKRLRTAIAFASHKNMQTMEREGVYHIPWLKPGNPEDPRSFKARKGVVGDWKNHFNNDEICTMNQIISEELLDTFGYKA